MLVVVFEIAWAYLKALEMNTGILKYFTKY